MFHERLEQEFKKAHRVKLPLALLFLDLDHFKEVNDTLGHDMGDLLLKEATQRITSCVRETDTVARLGGDEFTLILGELEEPDSVERIANSIVEKLAKPFQLGTELAQISASIGIAIYPNDATDVSSLLKNADLAMYAAKRQGRNQFHFYTSTMLETEIPPKTPAA
jgi:diguanylate cyclase (GGDEF)-like protein